MILSIVIPTKNEEVLLPKLLESIREQTFKDYEVIVADNHSSDRTREIAKAFGAKIVDGGLPGPGRNAGAVAAQGDILLFLDADAELIGPSFLEDCLDEFKKRELDVATCRVFARDGTRFNRTLHEAYNMYTIATEHLLPHAVGACFFIRREVHEKLHGFDEAINFAEDHEYARRARQAGFQFGILRSHKFIFSMRRYQKEGLMRTAGKYVFSEFYILTHGARKPPIFDYKFDHYREEIEK